ncbi:MAG TPA: hypothetical protein VIG33_06505 [Pseudobdellovibrionaceae bacterium]
MEVEIKPTGIAVEISCLRCGTKALICKSCWRNQRYCSTVCSREAKLERHRRDQKLYRMSPEGRERNKVHQRAYRQQKKIQE